MFSKQVTDQLKYYVYRVIDPRNGETFYVGKGIGNRIFAHVKGALSADEDEITEKVLRIRQIRLDGFESRISFTATAWTNIKPSRSRRRSSTLILKSLTNLAAGRQMLAD